MSQWNSETWIGEYVDITLKSTGETLRGLVLYIKDNELVLRISDHGRSAFTIVENLRHIALPDIETMNVAGKDDYSLTGQMHMHQDPLDDPAYANKPAFSVLSSIDEILTETARYRCRRQVFSKNPSRRKKHALREQFTGLPTPHSVSVESLWKPILSTKSETQTMEFVCPDGYAMSDVSVTEETWEITRDSLPEDLRWSVYFENNCWTLFRDPRNIKSTIPLRIAGAPLIIPVYSPPCVHPGTVSLPDPHPKLINPRADLTNEMVAELFDTFPFALAFYILYNGFCQIWVDDDFDFQWAASHFPREFGGLKVSYFTHGPSATSALPGPSGLSHIQSTFENTSHESISSGSQNIVAPPQISTTPTMKCGSEIEVKSPALSTIVGRSLRSRVGVSILMGGELVITMTSHGAIAPRIEEKKIGENIKKHGFWNRYLTKFLGRSENDRSESQQPKDSTKWWEGVEIYAAGTDKKVGDLCKTYDEEASEDTIYPIGFPYDISLIRPAQNKRMIGGIISPASEWYRDGALDTKSRLYVVGSHQIDGHGLPRRWSEPVGQGIMLNQGGLLPEQKWKADDVKRLVSRCTLWRPLNATTGWDGWSGAPVIVKKEDGTEALLGFQSFVQDSHHRQFPMPDDKLKEACTDGYISFGACMRLPEDVLNSVIVR